MLRPLSADVKQSLEEATAAHEANVEAVLPYLESRGISRATSALFRLGLVTSETDPAHAGRLAIPSIGPNGDVQSLRFRCLAEHDCGATDCAKYKGMLGVPTRLFNTRAIREAGDTIAICEGELDAITLCQAGIAAVAVTGVHNWKDHHARVFTGFSRVIVPCDNDMAGSAFGEKIRKAVTSAHVVTIGEAGDDCNSLYVREGAEALREALGVSERNAG